MFNLLFKKTKDLFVTDEPSISIEEKFFSNVVGYQEIKKLLLKATVAKEPIHILLTGPPSSSKTIFLLEMLDGLDNTYFVDAVGTSGAGIVDYLFNTNTKYLLIDEIDKMKKSDQAALLNIMDTGILSETKLNRKTRQKKMDLSIFATSNEVERLSAPLRSRFMELHLEVYTYEEFKEIVRRLLKNRYRLDSTISDKISYEVWYTLKSKDVRDALRFGKLTKSFDDVNWLIDVQIKYGKKAN